MDFDDVLNLEEQFYNEGFKEGQAESAKQSFIEGKEYGLQVGFQKYIIIGMIKGIIAQAKLGDPLSAQAESHLHTLEELIDNIKIDNDYGNVIQTEKTLVKIRNKLRVFVNTLPTKKTLTLKEIDEISNFVGAMEEEKNAQPSIGNLNDDGMW